MLRHFLAGVIASALLPFSSVAEQIASPIIIGLDADFTGSTSRGSEAIRIGALAAIEEINRAGGLHGRRLRLMSTDHRANPRRGQKNFRDLVETHGAVAVLTGLQSPVALGQLELAHRLETPILSPWAAATPFIDNGYQPSFAFRVSIRDAHAGGYLVGEAMRRGYRRFGLLMQNTPWGLSNQKALSEAIAATGLAELAAEVWYGYGASDLSHEVQSLQNAGVEAVFLIANPSEGAAAVKALSTLPAASRPVVFSHWGVVGGDIYEMTDGAIAEMAFFILQTFSFYKPRDRAQAEAFFGLICGSFRICEADDVVAPTGLAHAYDAVHLLARAIAAAERVEGPEIRDALERLGPMEGLLRIYDRPFTELRHEALDRSDFKLVRFAPDGRLIPVACAMVKAYAAPGGEAECLSQ